MTAKTDPIFQSLLARPVKVIESDDSSPSWKQRTYRGTAAMDMAAVTAPRQKAADKDGQRGSGALVATLTSAHSGQASESRTIGRQGKSSRDPRRRHMNGRASNAHCGRTRCGRCTSCRPCSACRARGPSRNVSTMMLTAMVPASLGRFPPWARRGIRRLLCHEGQQRRDMRRHSAAIR